MEQWLPIIDERGRAIGLNIVVEDISVRKQMEDALKESQRDYERAQAVGKIGNWRLNVRRNELIWSDQNYRIFGAPKGTPLTYETFLSFAHPDDRDYVDKKWKAAIAGEDYDIEHRIVSDGVVKWVREKAFMEFGKDRSLLGGFGITQDITDRKKAETSLSESEKMLQMALKVGRSFAFEWDPISDKVVRSESCSPILGLPGAEAISDTGKNYFQRIHPEDRKRFVDMLKGLKPGKDTYKIEYRVVRPDDTVIVLEEIAQAYFDADDTLVRLVGTATDITIRKEAEQILKRDEETLKKLVEKQAQDLLAVQAELEQAKRLSDVGVLAATVAHELRNPLAAIGVTAHNIKRKSNNPDIEKCVHTIDKKVTESDQIINNLLFYSRLRPPHYESINVLDIIEECVAAAEQQKKKEATVIKNLDSIKGITIEADPLQIREVFGNILNNAFDAIPAEKGQIKIMAENEDEFIKATIEDSGAGIVKDILDKIFEPFFTTKAKGTGLGLSVCKQIINMHEGEIGVKSELGQGTSFIVRLPKKERKKERKNKWPLNEF
jgi:PAS domain S-box-containing protein